MEHISFDRITRRLAVTTSRRRGVIALVAGAFGLAGISAAEAVVPVPPICRSTGMECSDSIPCCSGRCIVKRDGTSRCARKTSNRKKKHAEKNSDDKDTCIALFDTCGLGSTCCEGLTCESDVCCVGPFWACDSDADCCFNTVYSCINGVCNTPY